MTAVLMTPPYLQFFDVNGVPLNGGFVYTYTATGTFSTPKATYTTAAGDIEAPNPIELNGSGVPTTGNGGIWISGTYDFKVTDSLGNIIETQLDVTAFNTLPSSSNAYFQSFSGTGSQTAFTTSADLGSDEKAIYVWIDAGLQQAVTNGSFATDTSWTKGTGWTIAAGVATATGAISTALSQTAAITLIASQAYVLTYTVTRSAGGIIPSIGGTAGVERTAAGTYTEVISCGSTQVLAFTGNAFSGTLDNISVTVADPKGYEIQNPANYTISGTSLTFVTAPAVGTGNIYVSAPSLLVGAASSSAADAAASAASALASANQAAAAAGQLIVTSTTSLSIGTGSKVFTVSAGLGVSAGQFILIVSDASPSANYMWGQIASYITTTLTVTVATIGGSGTHTDWTMYLTGDRGATGATGSIGDLSGVPTASIATGDYVVFEDISNSNLTKRDTVANVLALTPPSTMTLLHTTIASSSASITFDSTYVTTAYDNYLIIVNNISGSTTLDLAIDLSVSGSYGGGTWNYGYTVFSGSVTTSSAASTPLNSSASFTTGVTGRMWINLTGVTSNVRSALNSQCVPGTTVNIYTFSLLGAAAVHDGIKITPSTGNIATGTFSLYGIKS